MKIFYNKKDLTRALNCEKNVGFVPTMGALHKGHISLIKKSKLQSHKTILSIFVNKPQFNKVNDYANYPRNLKKDIRLIKKHKVDYLYIPKSVQIYPKGINKRIIINSFHKKLCGRFRPKHFHSVVDVVSRFIKIIKPKRIYLGEKDLQQLLLIKDYLKNNKIKTKVVLCKTIREKNGIPYSSRNLLLTPKEKKIISKIYNFVKNNKTKIIKKRIKIHSLSKKFFNYGVNKIDYINFLDTNKIIKPFLKKKKYKIFLAYNINNVRLIDNI